MVTGTFPWIREPGDSCDCTVPVCCICHWRISCCFWYFSCSVHVSYYWAYSNRKICYFVFILLTMENDFFHDFGPFILFIILWLLMRHPFTSVSWKHFLLENIPCNFFPRLLFELSFFILFPSNIFPRFNMNPKDIGHILIKTLEIEGIYP